MRTKIKREHESEVDMVQFEYKQRLQQSFLKRPEAEVEMPLQINQFVGKLDDIHQKRILTAQEEMKQEKKAVRTAIKDQIDQRLQKVRQEVIA